MTRTFALACLCGLFSASFLHAAEDEAAAPAIERLKVSPGLEVFKSASRKKPLEIKSAEAAAEHFAGDSLAALKEKVDFEKQIVLVFAWRGSGQDKLDYAIAESFPEQITFSYKPGRTRDLRPHIYVFALRSNVTWSGP